MAHSGDAPGGVGTTGNHTTGVLAGIVLLLIMESTVLYLTFRTWFKNPNYPVAPLPERYFHAAIYSFVAMVLTGGILTIFFSGVDFAHTPLISVYGYNNVCVVFDSPPSTYICPVYWFFVAYLIGRYAVEDTKRLMLLTNISSGLRKVSYAVNVALVLVAAFFSMVLAVRPQDDVIGHTMPFVALVVVLPIVFLMHCLECKDRAPIYLVGVGIFLILSLTKAVFDIYALSNLSTGAHVPPSVAQAVDLMWLVCALGAPFVTPVPAFAKLQPVPVS
jgi:hypothetical protein